MTEAEGWEARADASARAEARRVDAEEEGRVWESGKCIVCFPHDAGSPEYLCMDCELRHGDWRE